MIRVKVLKVAYTLYKQIKEPLVDEHAFPLKGSVYVSAHVTNGGSSGIMPIARPELHYPCNSQAKFSEKEVM